jgi:hypothetical protein
VYSFGVLLFELFGYGGVPWHHLNNARVKEEVTAGHQLTPPDEAPSEVATLMKSCWSLQPEKRLISFNSLLTTFWNSLAV